MAEIVGVKIDLNGGEAIKTVGSLRQQLKASLTDLQQMQAEFGDISPQAIQAAKAVAGLRDSIKDANEVSALFDPEKKFQAVVGVAQGIASGFAAAQGAMALFGAESKEVEKALLKVQATMALAQGLSGLKAAVEDFKRLGAVLMNIGVVQKANALANTAAAATMRLFGAATTQTAVAFNVLKTAIVSTGIGALVVGVGLLINKLSQLTNSTNDQAEAQRALNKELTETANTYSDEIAQIYEDDKVRQIALAKARGATEQEIVEITKKANAEIIAERRKNALEQEAAGRDSRDARKALAKAERDDELFELAEQAKRRQAAEDAAQKAREKAASDAKTAREKEAREIKERDEKLKETFDAIPDRIRQMGEQQQAAAAAAEEFEAEQRTKRIDTALAEQDAQTQREKEHADARKEIAQKEAEAKVMAAQAVSQALMGFAALAGEQTQAGKLFAAASATIQGILGAQQAFTAMSAIPIVGPALGAIAAAGAIAGAIANVKKIYAVQIPGKGGSAGGPTPSISMGGAAPLAPQRPQIPTTRIDQESINNMGASPIRAYVVESDITTKQKRRERIESAAKFE